MEDTLMFGDRLGQYAKVVERLNVMNYGREGWEVRVEIEPGRRYIRILVVINYPHSGERKHIHTFVDSNNGDILKAAGYRAVAKNGVRGNIFASDCGESRINYFGAKYLK